MSALIVTEKDRDQYYQQLTALTTRAGAGMQALRLGIGQPRDSVAIDVDTPPPRKSNAAREVEEEVARAILLLEDQILNESRAALARLNDGTFGHCERCGRMVGKVRLDAFPYARHCLSCAATGVSATRPGN